jgi:uncharacterized protein (TIGR03437 family)
MAATPRFGQVRHAGETHLRHFLALWCVIGTDGYMSSLISEIDEYLYSRRHAASPVFFAALLTALALPALCQAQGYTVTTVAGKGNSKYAGDGGKATDASFSSPISVAVDKNGNIFVADNADCVIREFSVGGNISTVAGKPAQGCGYSGDGAATGVQLWPAALAVDAAGNVYIAEPVNGRVRKLTVGGNIVTVAGGGSSFSPPFGDGGLATLATLVSPTAVAVDAAGNVYIADRENYNVRKVATNGTISTVAGTGKEFNPRGGNGDGGPATSAIVTPSTIAIDAAGNLYIAEDDFLNGYDVRKVNAAGTISTFAGGVSGGHSGDGGPATSAGLSRPEGLAVDSAGNLFISEPEANYVRMVSTGGTITTIAGDGNSGYMGDGGPATSAEFTMPYGLAVSGSGQIYIADQANFVVRMLTGAASSSAPAISAGGIITAYSFGAFPAAASGSWIEIWGANLASDARSWTGADFTGSTAPTSLDGTYVTIGGQRAFLDYISSGQVNAQVPSNIGTGSLPVIVTTAAGASAPLNLTVNLEEPGLLAPPQFKIGATQYVVALFPDGTTYVAPPGAIANATSRRAKPGDIITLYGIGFGAVTPSIAAGQIVGQANTLSAPLHILFGGIEATLKYDGLAPSAVGLYQFNLVVPNVAASDTVPVTFTLAGVAGAQTLYIAVGN